MDVAMTMRCTPSHITAAKIMHCSMCSITNGQCSHKDNLQQMITMDVYPPSIGLQVQSCMRAAMTMRCTPSHSTAAKTISCSMCLLITNEVCSHNGNLQQMITKDVVQLPSMGLHVTRSMDAAVTTRCTPSQSTQHVLKNR